ncbi:hypothetical protein MATL_G00166880 [Megalops atlanticus]|uniref:F5/8 type C domain-containing protein n=1 Tax=Megalops atlanticus TaxID=7932 RepID=A0A9D3PQA4_MEGAT|nr:hypothetical protein MATL_G00166880 [Megalops atlanticus]
MKLLLFSFLLLSVCVRESLAITREFYIAAVESGWDYLRQESLDAPLPQRRTISSPKDDSHFYVKAVYWEYTDATFSTPKPKSPWMGIQGPTIRAEVNDRVVVHFKNFASLPFTICPIGISYWKQSEGAGYEDATSFQEKEDDAVAPGGYYRYVWDIQPANGPTVMDPDCLTYSYASQVDVVRDFNSGLIGALLICKAGSMKNPPQTPEFILFFAVFDETKSWYGEEGVQRDKFQKGRVKKQYHTVNGFVNSTLPGLKMCQKKTVLWHMIGMGSSSEIHSIRFQDHTFQVQNHRKVSLEVTPMSLVTAEMRTVAAGKFFISCQIHSHQQAGMNAFFIVENCPEPAPPPDKRYNKGNDYDMDYLDDLVTTIDVKPVPGVRSVKLGPKVWKHYIAIEEIAWDYAPELSERDRELSSQYLRQGPQRIGKVYKKAVYVEYTDRSFTQRASVGRGMMGPVLRGEVEDRFEIVLMNRASRPFNIYPNGLTSIQPLVSKAALKGRDLRNVAVQPNETFAYLWKITQEDGPTKTDPRCLTRIYQSTIDPVRDLASGLMGPLVVCYRKTLDKRGNVLMSDEEKYLMFAVFDENKSWYINENIQKYIEKPSSVDPSDPEFYNSNVMYNINGYMYNNYRFEAHQNDVTFWHVMNVGTQSNFLSIYFTGNTFERDNVYETVLTLFPMSGETVSMEMETLGEWEISALDSSLKKRGMSARYTVMYRQQKVPLVDSDDYIDFEEHLNPRGYGGQNRTVTVRVCKPPTGNRTLAAVVVGGNGTERDGQPTCVLKRITLGRGTGAPSQGEIPANILRELERGAGGGSTENSTGPAAGDARTSRSTESSRKPPCGAECQERRKRRSTALSPSEKRRQSLLLDRLHRRRVQRRDTRGEDKDREAENQVLKVSSDSEGEDFSHFDKMQSSQDQTEYGYNDQERQPLDLQVLDPQLNVSDHGNLTRRGLTLEYDDYNSEENSTLMFADFDSDFKGRSTDGRYRNYYIAAEEVMWDYGIKKPQQLIKPREMRLGMRKYFPQYKKVVFRAYLSKDFQEPATRGELEEHLGIMGPLIRAEINDIIIVTFKNLASRPYSFHLHGIFDRSQGEAFGKAPEDAVKPNQIHVYKWKVTKRQGPSQKESDCKAGAYYSNLDTEKDINSGLIGPMLVCKPGTLHHSLNTQPGVQDFALLFTVFDETKSWYLEENMKTFCTPPCHVNKNDPWFDVSNKFAAINGYVAETLPGLLVPQHHMIRWHLLNMGSHGEFHAVHFHGLPFTVRGDQEHRMGVYNLYPGVFATIEMRPAMVGTWMVECSIGEHQLSGMRAKLLVYNPKCVEPLGMRTGRILDSQITDSGHYGDWESRLARLELSGSVNAWSGMGKKSWIQVDLLRPTLIHGVHTQGASHGLSESFVMQYTLSYSLDQETWKTYKGNSTNREEIFKGNLDGSQIKENYFSPPIVGRYIRVNPLTYQKRPTLRLELFGCDLNSCSLPMGMEKTLIPNYSISASSFLQTWFLTWSPSLARLNLDGAANAWRPKTNNPHEWLQVDFQEVKRVTGVITQGARSMLTHMMVTEFTVSISNDGRTWTSVKEGKTQRERVFQGNNEHDEETLNVFEPPLFARYIRIQPKGWYNDIALRLEFLGCDTQQRL